MHKKYDVSIILVFEHDCPFSQRWRAVADVHIYNPVHHVEQREQLKIKLY